MSTSKRIALRLACATGGAVALVTLTAGASLAAVPPYQPGTSATGDVNNVGTLSFYDATGAQIFSGSTTVPVAPFVKTTGLTPVVGNKKAAMFYAQPTFGQTSDQWNTSPASGSTTFPVNAAAAPVKYFSDPVVTTSSNDESLNSAFTAFPLDTNSAHTGYYDMYEVRVYDTGNAGQDSNYASADILINPTNNTWTEVYPNVTSTTESVAPAVQATTGSPVVLSSTTTPAANGTVQFFDGKTAIGSPQAVTTSNGNATVTTSTLAAGAHNLYAAFTPTAVTDGASTSPSSALTESVATTPPASLPEAPYALLLPLVGLGAAGAISLRRKARKNA